MKTQSGYCKRSELSYIHQQGDEETHVSKRISQLCRTVNKGNAMNVYKVAVKNGSSIIGIFPNEECEFYKNQLETSIPPIKTEMIEQDSGD